MAFLLIHEARHADGEYPHTCGTTKDGTVAQMGAFGVQYYFGLWVAVHAQTPSLSDRERAYARWASQSILATAFCQECR